MSSASPGRPAVVYDGAVQRADLDVWESDLRDLIARIRPLWYRTESKQHAEQYIRGLLSQLERKNAWAIAEYAGEPAPTALQRLLNLSPWDVEALLAVNREYAMEHLSDPGAILVADPTGFAKKGTKSVGVQRQYSGTLGRIDNCQIATFIGYVTPGRDRVLLDRRLYMPKKSWMADPVRCAEAGVPPQQTFLTRPQQVEEMIESARGAGVAFAWFTADEEFGQNPGLRQHLEGAGIAYVMAIPKNTECTAAGGRSATIADLTARLRPSGWTRRACGIGAKGYRVYDWAVIDSADPVHQYLVRRSIDDGELAFYHCYNPRQESMSELVRVAGSRWPIEECFETGKGQVGLDNYQVRLYPAWYRHMSLAMLAETFLAVITHRHHAKKGDPQPRQPTVPGTATRPPPAASAHRRGPAGEESA